MRGNDIAMKINRNVLSKNKAIKKILPYYDEYIPNLDISKRI